MRNRMKKIALVLLAVIFAGIAGGICFGAIDSVAEEELIKATECTFVIPPDFVPGDEMGLFINQNSPMESSTIKYNYYDNGEEKVLTNREKSEMESSGASRLVDESRNLTESIYEKTISAAYKAKYKKDVDFKVSSFDKITVDGYPGYRIDASFQLDDMEKTYQTVYMILSRYRVFTVAYQRAEDDDCQEAFDTSAATIHVR